MKGTRINYKGLEYNPDGDKDIGLDSIPKVKSEKELKRAIADRSMHFIHLVDGKMYGVNKLVYKKKKFLLLEPNPVTFYYSLAFDSIRQMQDAKKLLEESLMHNSADNSKAQAFSFVFRVGSVGVVFSFLALEAFLNQMLPDYALIEYDRKMVTKDKIQRYATFEKKLQQIIPNLHCKDFQECYPKKYDKIIKLKRMRDELIHLKEVNRSGFTSYDDIYQDLISTDIKSLILAVKSYVNFYSPGLIVNYKNRTRIK